MRRLVRTAFVVMMLWLGLTPTAAGNSDAREVDGPHSTMTVRVFKSGFLSAFGHNHEIRAPIESGQVKESGNLSVTLHVDARRLRVSDPEVSDDTRAQIQKTMLGPQVLDADRFPEIRFQSTEVESKGPDHWIVHGKLGLHGKEHAIAVEATLKGEHYIGSASLKQTDFGITPVTVGGGTVKVKDEVKIEFDIEVIK
jgi:polyisoprenoid-binding protein YceI